MANRNDFDRLEKAGKATLFAGILVAGKMIGKKIYDGTEKGTKEALEKYEDDYYKRQGWFYKLTHKRPE